MLSRRHFILAAGALGLTQFAPRSFADEAFDVRMYSGHPDDPRQRMVFSPRILRVPQGATVNFIPEAPGHNCQSTPGMIPEGAEAWRGGFGKPHSVTLTVPGYYGYHCLPHRSGGMVGLIVVEGEGRDANLEAIKTVRQPGRAADVWQSIWTDIDATL